MFRCPPFHRSGFPLLFTLCVTHFHLYNYAMIQIAIVSQGDGDDSESFCLDVQTAKYAHFCERQPRQQTLRRTFTYAAISLFVFLADGTSA